MDTLRPKRRAVTANSFSVLQLQLDVSPAIFRLAG